MAWYIVDGILHRADNAPKGNRIPVDFPMDGELIIPEGISGIGYQAFAWKQGLTGVVIPEGVTSIGESAFVFCEGITSVELPESLTIIERNAFEYCRHLKSVVIPSGVTQIEEMAFVFCSALENVVLRDGVKRIGKMAFCNCSELKRIEIPASVRVIEQEAFGGCSNLDIVVPESVRMIDDHSFRGCRSLVLPEKFWWEMDAEAIKSLKILTCPVSVKEAPAYARTKMCIGFALNGDMYDEALRTEYCAYIKKNAAKLVSAAFDYPELLHLMCREKLIAAKNIDAFTEEAMRRENTEATAVLLDYQANVLTMQEVSKAREKKEQIREKQDDLIVERIEARVDKTGIDGLNFVVTGRLKTFEKRDDIKAYITERGGKLLSAMSAKTDYLITNDTDSGSVKNQKAAELGIVVITEDEFLKMAE